MKPINQQELDLFIEQFQSLMDARLQNILSFKHGFVFEFFKSSQSFYMILDLTPHLPFVGLFADRCPIALSKNQKPLQLFLKAHAIGKRLSEIRSREDLGRGFECSLGYESPVHIEFRIFPHGQNMIVSFEQKKISAFAVKDTIRAVSNKISSVAAPKIASPATSTPLLLRSLEDLKIQWLQTQQTQKSKTSGTHVSKADLLAKKTKAIDKIKDSILILNSQPWEQLGQWLQMQRGAQEGLPIAEDISAEFRLFRETALDAKKSLSQNIDFCFLKAKEVQQKLKGAQLRLLELEKEMAVLSERDIDFIPLENKNTKSKPNPSAADAKRFPLSEHCDLYIGKNAADNLKILRDSQVWHLWLHLKDYPGAHGILRFQKNYQPQLAELNAAAQKIAERSKKSHHQISLGSSFEVVITEKRFVKPIKGDKLGRVRFSDEKSYTFKKT